MSEFIEIIGGSSLHGAVPISGAKNAALPMLIASLLTSEVVEIARVPNLEDVGLTLHLLEHLGAHVEYFDGCARVRVPHLVETEASYSLVKALRASFWVLAPLLARGRAARVSLPGGDIIGARPVDMHLAGLSRMGADLKVKHGIVYATAPAGLRPARVEFRFPSVGATHQIMMAAALTPGTTVIEGAAREPEVVALACLLNSMGGDIEGAGSSTIAIRGKASLGGASVSLIGDRIEAGTYLLAAAACGGEVTAQGIDPTLLGAFAQVLTDLGLTVTETHDSLTVRRDRELRPIDVVTGPFPHLATDLQAPLMAALCFARGISTIEETVFEGRFGHVSELCRLGAHITVEDRIAKIHARGGLQGAPVDGHDIRAAAALVIAALGAEGTSQLYDAHHLRRGYEELDQKFSRLGARIHYRPGDVEDYLFAGC